MQLKTIHRIFFGFGGEKDIYLPYLELWKKALPHYDFKLWNASNLPLDLNPWTRKMTELQDGVFLSDFFRWWVCKEYGGVYLDADIEIYDAHKFDSLIQELEKAQEYDSIIGIESNFPIKKYTSHSFASKKNSRITTYMCNLYANLDVLSIARKKMLIGPDITNLYFMEYGNQDTQLLSTKLPIIDANVKILPIDFFSPLQYGAKPSLEYFSENTCLAHHYGGAWVDKDSSLHIWSKEIQASLSQKRPKLLQDYISKQNKIGRHIKNMSEKILKWILFTVLIPPNTKRRLYFKKILISMVEK